MKISKRIEKINTLVPDITMCLVNLNLQYDIFWPIILGSCS